MVQVWRKPLRKNASAFNKLNYIENCIDGYTDEFGKFDLQSFVADFCNLKDALQKYIPNLAEFLDEHPIYADNKVTSLLLGLLSCPEPESGIFANFAECLETKNAFCPIVENPMKQFSAQTTSCPEVRRGTTEGLHVGDRIALYVSEVGGWLPVVVEKITDDKRVLFKNETVGLNYIFKPENVLEWLPSERYNLPNTSEDNNTIQAINNKEIWK